MATSQGMPAASEPEGAGSTSLPVESLEEGTALSRGGGLWTSELAVSAPPVIPCYCRTPLGRTGDKSLQAQPAPSEGHLRSSGRD